MKLSNAPPFAFHVLLMLLLVVAALNLAGCSRGLPVTRQEVIGAYDFERGRPESSPQRCVVLHADGTYQAQGLHQREKAVPASGTWQLDDDPSTSISVGLFTNISKNKSGTVTIHLPESENGYDCVKH